MTDFKNDSFIREARQFLLRLLRKRFGPLPASAVARVEEADREWCEEMAERALNVESLQDLDLS